MCVVALAGAALLAGCSAEPVLLNGSDQGVVVRYSQSHATAADAAAVATKYCAQYGRQAVQGDGNSMTGDTFLSFTCEKP
jgi:putative hemolysin